MVTRVWRRAVNAFWEMRLGIATRGRYHPDFSGDDNIYYGTQSYDETIQVLKQLRLGREDVFVDLGCGKGRVICLASRFALGGVIGVELSSELCQIARRNAQMMRGKRTDILVHNINAEDFDYTVGTVFYLFHPFGPRTMQNVLERMSDGLNRNPRQIRIVYSGPVHEDLFSRVGWLERYSRWTKHSHRFVHEIVSFWRSKDTRDNNITAYQEGTRT